MKKKFTIRYWFLTLFFGTICHYCFGQTMFTNPITDANPGAANPYTNGQFYEPDITVSGIGRSAGLTASSAANRYSASNWSTMASIDLSKYFEFVITPSSGFSVDFLSFVYTGQISSGTPMFAFRSSLDGFTANIGMPTATGATISLNLPAFQGITSAITFRFYVYNIAGAGTTFSINDFSFNRLPQYFQSAIASGDWNAATTWISSPDNSTFLYHGLIPSSSDKTIIVKNSNIVNITTSILMDETTVIGKLQVSGTGVLNLNNGTGDDLTISSTGIVDAGATAFGIASGSVTVNITGKLMTAFLSGFTGAGALIANGTVTLNSGSTIEYYASSGTQSITARADYYNITFSGGGTKTLGNTIYPLGTVHITGNAIVNTNSHNFGDGGATPPYTNFTMDGGRLILTTTGMQPYMTGTYNLTAGVVEFASSQVTAQTIRNNIYQNIEVTGNNVGNSSGNITLNTNGTFTVKTGGVFTINDNNIVGTGIPGSQTVTVENGAIFKCGNNQGFNGYLATLSDNSSIAQNITNIDLNVGSTVQYIRDYSLSYPNQPITNANGLIYSNLSLSGTSTKIAPVGVLTIQGNLGSVGGTFLHNNGTVLLNGNNAQIFAGLTYNNLILANNIKTTSGNSTIIDSVSINDNTQLSISAADSITLQSDALKTARIGQIGNGTINYNTTGKFVVERYINTGSGGGAHGKSWQLLAVPTYTTQTIKDAWQEGATLTNVSSPSAGSAGNPKGGYGTMLTSNVTNAASQTSPGFDVYTPSGPSIKVYNSATDGYDGPASTLASITNPKGYFILVTGDRSVTTYNSAATATRLRTAGQLYTSDITQHLPPSASVGATQFASVGNPYKEPFIWRGNQQYRHSVGSNYRRILWIGCFPDTLSKRRHLC